MTHYCPSSECNSVTTWFSAPESTGKEDGNGQPYAAKAVRRDTPGRHPLHDWTPVTEPPCPTNDIQKCARENSPELVPAQKGPE